MSKIINDIMKKLNLSKCREVSISNFLEKDRLKPYIFILEENPDFQESLKKIYPDKIKDQWDCVVELYRYNIKLSKSIYPYLAILENILKIKISNYFKEKYGEDFYYNRDLIFNILDFDIYDIETLNTYFSCKINQFVRTDLTIRYKEKTPLTSKSSIQSKINKIKIAISILSDAEEYRFKNPSSSFTDFVTTKPTLNYWINLLELSKYYLIKDNTHSIELKKIFPKIEKEDIKTLSIIINKLNDIRVLRNYISHYNRIIYNNINKNVRLINIYSNIKELYYLLGVDDLNYVIGDINCCNEGSFESLYKKLEFIHERFKNVG